jgi:hypothetical protein
LPSADEVASKKRVALGGGIGQDTDQNKAVHPGDDRRRQVQFVQGCEQAGEFAKKQKAKA